MWEPEGKELLPLLSRCVIPSAFSKVTISFARTSFVIPPLSPHQWWRFPGAVNQSNKISALHRPLPTASFSHPMGFLWDALACVESAVTIVLAITIVGCMLRLWLPLWLLWDDIEGDKLWERARALGMLAQAQVRGAKCPSLAFLWWLILERNGRLCVMWWGGVAYVAPKCAGNQAYANFA